MVAMDKYTLPHYIKNHINPPLNLIPENLYLGDSWAGRRKEILEGEKIHAVLSVAVDNFCKTTWYAERIPRDFGRDDMIPYFATICEFIDKWKGNPGNVLIHCDMGISRSTTAVVAYLMKVNGWGVEEALEYVKGLRRVRLNKNFMEQLKVWEETGYEIWEDEEKTAPKKAYAAYLAVRAERLKEAGLTGNEPVGLQSLD